MPRLVALQTLDIADCEIMFCDVATNYEVRLSSEAFEEVVS